VATVNEVLTALCETTPRNEWLSDIPIVLYIPRATLAHLLSAVLHLAAFYRTGLPVARADATIRNLVQFALLVLLRRLEEAADPWVELKEWIKEAEQEALLEQYAAEDGRCPSFPLKKVRL